jgi:alpha-N-arabinofuranosidase
MHPWLLCCLLCCLGLVVGSDLRDTAHAANDLSVYDDGLRDSWENWSWASTDLASTSVVHAGTTSVAVNADAWSALWFRHAPFDTTDYGSVSFWINGGPVGGQRLHVAATLADAGQSLGFDIPALAPGVWQQITIPLSALGAVAAANFTGFWLQEWTGTAQPTFYVDDVAMIRSVPITPPPPLDHGMALYGDRFAEGWENWSWASVDPANTRPVNSGTSALAVRAGAFTALAFHHAAMDTSNYASLTFWINVGSPGGQVLTLRALLSGAAVPQSFALPAMTPNPQNPWRKITVPLGALGVAGKPDLTDIWMQETGGADQTANPFYIDDVRLDLGPAPARVQVAVDGKHALRTVDPRLFGLNANIWDGSFNTSTTADLLLEADNQALRFGGGSLSDAYHWQTNTSEGQTFQWATNLDAFANVALATRASVFITANYGSGSPQEAADEVRYANRTKQYGFKYWEIGNENYGNWELDNNTRPHDPVTYATRFKDYAQQMTAIDRSIKVGAVVVASEDSFANYADESAVNPRTGATHQGWNAVMLATLKQLGVTPDFVIYHRYEQAPGGESDAFLLDAARTWASDAAAIRQMLNDYLGDAARRVEIICTENNSVFSNPGKQTTSLVNGLFMADSLANIMKTEFNGFFWWNLRNGQLAVNNNDPSLYGWRQYGDYGIVTSAVPAGPADRYPTFYIHKLFQHFARGRERVVAATSDYTGLGIYAVRDRCAHTLNLLMINKHPTATLDVDIAVRGFRPARSIEVFSYGIPQDEAARTATGSADIARSTAVMHGSTFTWRPAPYSATVLRLARTDDMDDHDDSDGDHDDCRGHGRD